MLHQLGGNFISTATKKVQHRKHYKKMTEIKGPREEEEKEEEVRENGREGRRVGRSRQLPQPPQPLLKCLRRPLLPSRNCTFGKY